MFYVKIPAQSGLLGVLYVKFPLLQQQLEARERTWVVQRAVVRHPAHHGHVGGHSAHKQDSPVAPPWSAKTAVQRTRRVRPCTAFLALQGGGDWAVLLVG